MTRKHDAIFDDVLSGLDAPSAPRATPDHDAGSARFLKRSTTISERLAGEIEEKTLRWIDPARCRMWTRHNREYALLTEDNCRDLIDGIRAQGRQEFPAIVRPVDDTDYDYEVICGARRHFAVSWLRAHNYTQFRYLIETRTLTDEEAFRLADIENRDREDISDYERAIDYADAVARYYGGKQKAMAERLEVSQPWLSRYLQLAKLPDVVIAAFANVREIRERNARELKPLLGDPETCDAVLDAAASLARQQQAARDGQGAYVDAAAVMRRLTRAGRPSRPEVPVDRAVFGTPGIAVQTRGRKVTVSFDDGLTRDQLEAAFAHYLQSRFDG
ncbi:chromosome partitioning protein ParB [Salipiger aestuarii]|uniref:ParB family chromosome partitioning protein n=1 Tax=Salipiger aestuarii TaxID=568098 RepID=A0A327YFL3_9RHOB|nr:ParB/RepB/Spo0J family partition protein [Salipiger aestuarii]KAB2543076.1 chromosome partitioning protein ParB [Salipiger aestuarii]RAK19654.1 ParB family chromosome partitioning protein [Salipiger aestuarii]